MKNSIFETKASEISNSIFRYCRSRTSSIDDAEDLAQEIMLELVKSADNLRDEEAFYGFMWSVAANVYKQWCRKKSHRVECELTDEMENVLPSQEDKYDFGEDTEIYSLRQELTLLTKKYRDAVILYYIHNKSCKEIADELGTNESMVKYLLFKSRQKMKEGLTMERKLGTLSYDPKNFHLIYFGTGKNGKKESWEFMQNKIRQNIVTACYNDYLTEEEISLELGVGVPYIEEELNDMCEKNILLRDGRKYTTNLVLITKECYDEISRVTSPFADEFAEKFRTFCDSFIPELRTLGFYGADMSDNTLRWQLAVFYMVYNCQIDWSSLPLNAWGENAYMWFREKNNNKSCGISTFPVDDGKTTFFIMNSTQDSAEKRDEIIDSGKIQVLKHFARHRMEKIGNKDSAEMAELIRDGYLIKDDGLVSKYRPAMPIYSAKQYDEIMEKIKGFSESVIKPLIEKSEKLTEKTLSEHTPKHLKNQIEFVAKRENQSDIDGVAFFRLLESGYLAIDANPFEKENWSIVLNHK